MRQASDRMSPGDLETLTKDEVADILKCSTKTVDRLVRKREFPGPFPVGRSPRWLRSTVEKHLVQQQTTRSGGNHARL